jgi:hypothetical protein
MSHPVTRIYESRAHAAAATAELAESGFAADTYYTVEHPGGEKPEAAAAIVADLTERGVAKALATAYAAEIVQGGALVTVLPAFGFALTAEHILDSHSPIGPSAGAAAPVKLREYDETHPLSSALGLPTTYGDATPLSRFWNLPVLIDPALVSTEGLRLPMLSAKAYIFDQWKMLSGDATPLSTALGWGVKAKTVFYAEFFPLLTSARDFMIPPKLIDSTKSFFSAFPALTDKTYVFASSAKLSDKVSPLSEALSWPMATSFKQVFSGIPTILQSQVSIPTLLDSGRKFMTAIPLLSAKQTVMDMWPMLTAKVSPLSEKFNWPMLSEKISPLSEALRMPILSAKQHVTAGFPMLIKSGTTVSGMVGMPTIVREL